MYRMTDEEFETAIAEALEAMPEQFMEALNNVAIVWEEEPSAYHVGYDEEWDIEPAFVEDEDGPESYTPAERDAKDDAAAEDAGRRIRGGGRRGRIRRPSRAVRRAVHRGRANGYDDDIPDVITIFKGPQQSAASTAARKSWKRSARPSSMSWATTSALTRTSWPAMGYE